MQEFTVNPQQAGQRLDKVLGRYLSLAPKDFLYKMLRKKNIVLNGKKALGSELVQQGDLVRLYLSDETIEKFTRKEGAREFPRLTAPPYPILYEDETLLVVDKPAGVLSQKASASDISANEMLLGYLLGTGQITTESMRTFTPGVCNRLDRNTSGLLFFGKTLAGARAISALLQERALGKYYLGVVAGRISQQIAPSGWLSKEQQRNVVTVTEEERKDARPIRAVYTPLDVSKEATLLQIQLLTGRSHQIRAQLASLGHPIWGDPKYGDREKNGSVRYRYGVRAQLLHCAKAIFPADLTGVLAPLAGRTLTAPLPPLFAKVCREEFEHNEIS